MPELPEVEIMVRNLRSWLVGKTLDRLELRDRTWLRAGEPEIARGLVISQVKRRAKYASLVLSGEANSYELVLHYRMTGKTVRIGGGRRHLRAVLVPTDGEPIGFDDARRLGQGWLLHSTEAPAFWKKRKLGPEIWPCERSASWWAERLGQSRGQLKPALMRQDRIAGIGNILATEICHRAGLAPSLAACKLDIGDWTAIAVASREAIESVLSEESGDEIHYVSQGRETPSPFLAYGRGGLGCLRCRGAEILETRQSGRSTFHCPVCQPAG